MNLNELNKQYCSICNEYIKKFSAKQEIQFDGWVGDEIGGIASFCQQYFFGMDQIILDLNTKQPKGLILSWQNENTDCAVKNKKPKYINYKSYTKGLRLANL